MTQLTKLVNKYKYDGWLIIGDYIRQLFFLVIHELAIRLLTSRLVATNILFYLRGVKMWRKTIYFANKNEALTGTNHQGRELNE